MMLGLSNISGSNFGLGWRRIQGGHTGLKQDNVLGTFLFTIGECFRKDDEDDVGKLVARNRSGDKAGGIFGRQT